MKRRKELVLLPFQSYNEMVLDVTKELSEDYGKVCYITLNKTFRAMLKLLAYRKANMEKFYFVDSISPGVLKQDPSRRCVFVDSLDNLEGFAEKILSIIREQKLEAVVFDSLSSFLVYKSDEEVTRFMDYLVPFLEQLEVSMTFIALSEDGKRPAVKQMEMLVDRTKKL